MRAPSFGTKPALGPVMRATLAVLLAAFACRGQSRADVLVTEFPRNDKAAEAEAATGGAAKAPPQSPTPGSPRDAAAEYLRGLRESARDSVLSDKEMPPPPATDEIKLDLIPTKERQERAQLGYRRLRVPKGTYGVEGHGTPRWMLFKNGEALRASELARWIRNDPRYVRNMTVYLLACETGKGKYAFGQELADILQADVYAPTEKLWIHRDGTFSVYPRAGALSNGPTEPAAKARTGIMRLFHPAPATAR